MELSQRKPTNTDLDFFDFLSGDPGEVASELKQKANEYKDTFKTGRLTHFYGADASRILSVLNRYGEDGNRGYKIPAHFEPRNGLCIDYVGASPALNAKDWTITRYVLENAHRIIMNIINSISTMVIDLFSAAQVFSAVGRVIRRISLYTRRLFTPVLQVGSVIVADVKEVAELIAFPFEYIYRRFVKNIPGLRFISPYLIFFPLFIPFELPYFLGYYTMSFEWKEIYQSPLILASFVLVGLIPIVLIPFYVLLMSVIAPFALLLAVPLTIVAVPILVIAVLLLLLLIAGLAGAGIGGAAGFSSVLFPPAAPVFVGVGAAIGAVIGLLVGLLVGIIAGILIIVLSPIIFLILALILFLIAAFVVFLFFLIVFAILSVMPLATLILTIPFLIIQSILVFVRAWEVERYGTMSRPFFAMSRRLA